jgi:hypothetical protein
MKANELRVGNYVKGIGYNISWLVDGVDTYDIYSSNAWRLLSSFEGIPLNEKWLLKFGFRKNKDNRWMRGKSRYAIFYFEYYATGEDNSMWRIEYHDTDYGRNEYKDCNQWGDRIKYVHQLQNLYFALTGDELTINC